MPTFCRYCLLITLVLLVGFLELSAQDKKLISGDFQGLNFDQFVQALESKSDYHFYYNAAQFDSFRVNLSVTNKILNSILDEAFLHTDFHYSIDEQNNVFVIRRFKIETKLPRDFFVRKKDMNDSSKNFVLSDNS